MSKYKIAILVLVIVCIALIGMRHSVSYVGTHYPPYPNGTKFYSSVGLGNDKFFDTHTVAEVSTPRGPEIWLSRIENKGSKGTTIFIVTDSLQAPDKNGTQFITAGLCGKLSSDFKILHDPFLVALASRQIYENPQTREKEYRDQAIRAWKINAMNEKFEKTPPEGIYCNTTDASPGYSD